MVIVPPKFLIFSIKIVTFFLDDHEFFLQPLLSWWIFLLKLWFCSTKIILSFLLTLELFLKNYNFFIKNCECFLQIIANFLLKFVIYSSKISKILCFLVLFELIKNSRVVSKVNFPVFFLCILWTNQREITGRYNFWVSGNTCKNCVAITSQKCTECSVENRAAVTCSRALWCVWGYLVFYLPKQISCWNS